MQERIKLPVTPPAWAFSITHMTPKPGRRVGTPTDFKEALARRVKYARELAGYSHAEIARLLTKSVGREVSADTYRKWESTESSIAHDAILAFCDITKTHPYQLLAKPSDDELSPVPTPKKRVSHA